MDQTASHTSPSPDGSHTKHKKDGEKKTSLSLKRKQNINSKLSAKKLKKKAVIITRTTIFLPSVFTKKGLLGFERYCSGLLT